MKEREPTDDTPVLEAKNLYHVYTSNEEDGNVVALRGLSVSIKSGEAVAVVGPSGSGKSTLLKALGGLMKPSAGSVYLNGQNMTRITGSDLVRLRQETVSFIFQEGNLLPDLNALDNIAQPLRHSGVRGKEARKRAMEMLESLGIADRAYSLPPTLSGGEAQRVAIGRALITNPKVILADEPTGALDPITGRRIIELFRELNEESGVAFLIVTHSREISSFANRALELRDGRFVAQHGNDVDDLDLAATRELLIDDTGTLSMPPDMLATLGGPGRFEILDIERDSIRMERVDEEKLQIDEGNEMKLAPACPACGYDYGSSSEEECPTCGATRPMVSSS
tara:strand:- start:3650 stop:4663 length:1014 start_codon:yes stop_codon:yes gene_type:complete